MLNIESDIMQLCSKVELIEKFYYNFLYFTLYEALKRNYDILVTLKGSFQFLLLRVVPS